MKEKKKTSEHPRENKKEELTDRDLKELMGVHRPRYERRKGSVRQKK